MLPLDVGDDGFFVARPDYQEPVGPGLLGAAMKQAARSTSRDAAGGVRRPRSTTGSTLATPLRRLFNKVFPDHWSFLLGEIALYSFIVLLLTGTFLALFFDPSMTEVTYNGSYAPLRGIEMSQAYETSLNLSFDVRGGLIMRQMHHWAALLFMAAIVVHMLRVFFTGAFRKPRELNWIIGVLLFWLGFLEGFAGYSLPDDALSGTGLRIASAIMLSIPVDRHLGDHVAVRRRVPRPRRSCRRLYIVHVLLIPAILLALITVHMALLVKQKHTQWPGPGRDQRTTWSASGCSPAFAVKAGGFFMIVFGDDRAAGRPLPDQPDLAVRPVQGRGRLGGEPARLVRHVPRRLDPSDAAVGATFSLFGYSHYTIPPIFWPTVVLPGILTDAAAVLSVHRGPDAARTTRCTTCSSARVTCRRAPRSAPWRSRSTWCCCSPAATTSSPTSSTSA